jgi:hypothetical protein
MKAEDLEAASNAAVDWALEKYGDRLTNLAVAHLNEIGAKPWLWKSCRTLEKRQGESRSWNIAKQIFEKTIQLAYRDFAKSKRVKR